MKTGKDCQIVTKSQGEYSQQFILFQLMDSPKKLECYITQGWKMLIRDKHYSFLEEFISFE